MNKVIRAMLLLFIAVVCMGNDGCNGQQQQKSSSGANQAQVSRIPKNSHGLTVEQQNIQDRIAVTTDPTKVLWIHLIGLDGKIIQRMAVRNKVTSSGKRLEPRHAADTLGGYPDANSAIGNGAMWETDEFIQPDGTYGESDPYIFWFDPMGRYHQWGTAGGLGYLLTDYPIDLKNPIDEISGLYRVQKEALEWQMLQEERLKKALPQERSNVQEKKIPVPSSDPKAGIHPSL